ncbi:MAG: hypothetical protein IJC29_04885, partial [Clostridia bacterium]|nr:hypothetical protein [Clostridia bacterium]
MEQAFLVISILACIVSVGLFFTLRKTYYLFTFAAMLLLPKVNLFVVSGSMTGIRAEDLLLLFFFIGHLRGIWELLKKNKPLLFLTALVVALVGAGFVSTALGASAGTVARELVSLLASVRKGEYFVTLFLGVYLIRTVDTRTLVRWISHVAVVLTPICILQRKALLGYFYAGGYISKKSLPAAVFNGPYEYAAVCCLLFVVALVLLLRARDFHIKRDWYGILGLGLLFFQLCSTQSRTVLAVCVTVAFVAAVFYKGGRRARLALLLAVCLVLVVFLSMPSLLERLLHIDLAAMKETVQKALAERDYFAALENLPY